MNLSAEHLTALRSYLKEFTASTTEAEHQKQVDVINSLIPALVDTISDEELTAMSNEMWGYVMTGIITTNSADKESSSQAAETEAQPTIKEN